jgi:hypothetical protein
MGFLATKRLIATSTSGGMLAIALCAKSNPKKEIKTLKKAKE